MAENYGSLEGVLDANETLEGEIDSHDEMSGEIQFAGGVGGVKDVQVNNESVVDANKVAHIDLTPYAEKEDVYDKQTIDTALEGKADTDDIPTKLSQLDNDDNYVQDAEYVHTDNNFTDEDKAAIGNIPENITDLSDVEVSNIQNGQVLKWDSTQNKFVNANESGGGSGDVADVKVNGTSVVDPVTKEANIDLTGYAETSDIPTDLADLSDDSTHRLVTDTEKAGWDAKADTSDIPTVNNNTITIQKNGQNVDSFNLNQDSNKTINIAVPTKTSDLQNDDSFITNTVNNLANYYLKSDTYTQTEVNNLISAAVNGRFEKVTTLPASGEPNVIYLVPKTTALTNNVYDEYIWQDNAWELLGSTEIDLSNYVTTTDLSTALADYVTSSTFNTTIANYYTKTEVGNLLDGKVDKVSGKGLSTYDYDATAKGIVDNVTTNLAGKVDKVNGKGLSTEDYTTTEKNKLAGISTGANKVESSTTNGNIRIDGTETQVYDGSGKVDKVNGKGLSTNDYDNTDKAKVDKIDPTTTSISGNPISISGLKSNQLAINPIITFEPIQAGSGTPSPVNQRPISGYDKVEALSCGVNVWNEHTELGLYDVNTGLPITSTGNLRSKSNEPIIVKGNETYYWKQTYNGVVFFYDNADNFISNYTIPSGGNTTFTTPSNAKYVRFHLTTNYGTTYKNDVSINYPSTVHDYIPYVKATSISEPLGQTVYYGELDARSGKFKVKGAYYPITSDSTIVYASRTSGCDFFRLTSILGKPSGFIISNEFNGVTGFTGAGEVYISSQGYPIFTWAEQVYDASTFKQFLIDNNAVIVYELATPFTIQLTPHEISLLKDYAYVSTNGTNIALDYHNGELASLADVSQLGETVNNLDNYYGANNSGATQAGAYEDITTGHTTSNTRYVFPYDGYITADSNTAASGNIRVTIYGANDRRIAYINMNITNTYQTQSLYVRKGMKCQIGNVATGGGVQFNPLV